jgi:branched-chain amino acid transport system substrate-binding protein
MKKYYPQGDLADISNVYGYSVAQTLVYVLKQCGDDVTRENVMRQAANIKDLELPLALPGVKVNTGPNDFFPIEQLQLMRFDGKRWVMFGDLLTGESR